MAPKTTMKVAVAGTGYVSGYMREELNDFGYEVVVLTRSKKSNLKYEQRETDYSVDSLVSVLKDVDALVSTVADFTNISNGTKAHMAMLEAVKQSERTKIFIPSEWTNNAEEFPEEPVFLADHNKTLHSKLKQEKDIKWTIICNGWFADYVVPSKQRILGDVGTMWPMDIPNKVFTTYGTGTQLLDMTAVRDVAKSVAALLDTDEPWEPYTYLSGSQLSWNDLFNIVKKRDPEWTSRKKPLPESIQQILDNKSEESVIAGWFETQAYTGALIMPKEKVQRHRSKYFANLHFRNVEEILDEAAANPDKII